MSIPQIVKKYWMAATGLFLCLFFRSFAPHFKKTIIMGRGDKKTKKGKIFKGSFGKSRPANVKKATPAKEEKKA